MCPHIQLKSLIDAFKWLSLLFGNLEIVSSSEISFLELMTNVIASPSGKPSDTEGQKSIDDAFKVANNYGAVTAGIRNRFKEIVFAALRKFTRIGISLEEDEMVLEAMGLTRGHWFRCPNGHVYAIGDCGGLWKRASVPNVVV